MLCSMCQHGVTRAVNNVLTGNVWDCTCGENNCRHIDKCKCGKTREQPPAHGDYLQLDAEQHTIIDRTVRALSLLRYVIEDNRGADYLVTRDESNDTQERRGWKLTHPQTNV